MVVVFMAGSVAQSARPHGRPGQDRCAAPPLEVSLCRFLSGKALHSRLALLSVVSSQIDQLVAHLQQRLRLSGTGRMAPKLLGLGSAL